MKQRIVRFLMVGLILGAVFGSAILALADTKVTPYPTFNIPPPQPLPPSAPWTTVAAAGTVSNLSKVDIEGFFDFWLPSNKRFISAWRPLPYVTFKNTATGGVNIRYNVVAVPDLVNYKDASHYLTVRFLDSFDANTSVKVELYEFNMDTGKLNSLMKLNSNDYNSSNKWQKQTVKSCDKEFTFDFNENAYYIEATLKRDSSEVNKSVGLASIKIGSDDILCIPIPR